MDLADLPDGLPDGPGGSSEKSEQVSAENFLAHFRKTPGARIFVDLTASDAPTRWYRDLVAAGVAVVAANKRFFAGPAEPVEDLLCQAAATGVPIGFEATVGAGLPLLRPLRDLLRMGDEVQRIEGVLSGTLNAVLDLLSAGTPFSQAVRQAHAEGLTEPHPYDDLSGEDVGRKLLILARLAGFEIKSDALRVEPLLPPGDWAGMPLATFWQRIAKLDGHFEEKRRQATAEGRRLRYLGSVRAGSARVKLQAVPPEHPAYSLSGAENLVAVHSRFYPSAPWIVRGPGAGPEVTAAGVLADILAAAEGQRGGQS
jgi:aspartokinase/homoserine dehydrogenase 1